MLPCCSIQDIEKRLSRPIAALGADLSLPADIESRVKGGAGDGAATQYGQQRGGGVSKEVLERVQVSEQQRTQHRRTESQCMCVG